MISKKSLTTIQPADITPSYLIVFIIINLLSYSVSAYFLDQRSILNSLVLTTGSLPNSPFYTWIFVSTGTIMTTEISSKLNLDVGFTPLVTFMGKLTGYISFNNQSILNATEIMTYNFNSEEKILTFLISLNKMNIIAPVFYSFNIQLKATDSQPPLSCQSCPNIGFEYEKGVKFKKAFTKYLIPTAYKYITQYACKPTSFQLVQNRNIQCSKICSKIRLLTIDKKNNKEPDQTKVSCCQEFYVATSVVNSQTNVFCKEKTKTLFG